MGLSLELANLHRLESLEPVLYRYKRTCVIPILKIPLHKYHQNEFHSQLHNKL